MRSAEALRTSTCSFADEIARLCIDEYWKQRPPDVFYNQSVLSAFVLESPGLSGLPRQLRVVALGVGTKYLPNEVYEEHMRERHGGPCAILRDCHAEVLARRSLIKFFIHQVGVWLKSRLSVFDPSVTETSHPWCVLEAGLRDGRLRLKEGHFIHMYSSSQPCGNASIKRWAKNSPYSYAPPQDCSQAGWPVDLSIHPRFVPNAISEGEVSVLVKRGCSSRPLVKVIDSDNDERKGKNEGRDNGKGKSKVSALAPAVPEGCAVVGGGSGYFMTCSDKIAQWNAVGLQGGLLSNVMHPVYLSSITIGRKYGRRHCERGLCCRLSGFSFPPTPRLQANTTQNRYKKPKAEKIEVCGVSTEVVDVEEVIRGTERPDSVDGYPEFSLHHPAMLCTAVKFDDGVVVTAVPPPDSAIACEDVAVGRSSDDKAMAGGDDVGRGSYDGSSASVGASFTESRCLLWWLGLQRAVVVEGRTGQLVSTDQGGGMCVETAEVDLSSLGLWNSLRALMRMEDHGVRLTSDDHIVTSSEDDLFAALSAMLADSSCTYRDVKTCLAGGKTYWEAKQHLRSGSYGTAKSQRLPWLMGWIDKNKDSGRTES